MPLTYPLTFPTVVAPESVKVKKVWAAARFPNPLDFTDEVQLRNAARYELDITIQSMNAALAQQFTQFFENLQGGFGYFAFNLNPYCPGISPAPGTRNFRLATNDHGWDSKYAVQFGFQFVAIERL